MNECSIITIILLLQGILNLFMLPSPPRHYRYMQYLIHFKLSQSELVNRAGALGQEAVFQYALEI